MSDLSRRPWLDLYQGVPSTIEPASETALDMFRATLARGGRDAVLARYFDEAVTAGEIDTMSDALAVDLQRRGVEPGDRVAMYLQNIPQVLVTVLAAWKCGAVIVPCNPMLRERELAKILSDSGSRVIICQEDLFAEVTRTTLPSTAVQHSITTSPLDFLPEGGPLPPVLAGVTRARQPEVSDLLDIVRRNRGLVPAAVEMTGDDVAFMVYTSGTTGAPKAAMNTHGNVVFATTVYERWIGLTQADVILGLAPLFHVTGLIGHVTLALLTGSPLLLFYRFEAAQALKLAQHHRATFTVSAVTAFIALLNSDAMKTADLSGLTKVYTGGAPTPPGVLTEWHERTGVRIQPMYGLTEATSPTHMTPHGTIPPVDPRTGAMSVGVPVFNTQVRVVTDAGLNAGPREIGELVIKGPQIIPAYWQKPEETAKSLGDGELRTGDVGFFDEHGWFYLVDRAKDMIVASGFKVWPREVEEVLYLHPAVREAAVIGVPDPYRGETIKAVISVKPGMQVTEQEIKAFARERMAAYKYPRFVEIIDELPKTTSGKIMRRLLQTATRQAAAPLRGVALAPVTYPQLRAAVEARSVLEIGAVWLRVSRGGVPRFTAEALYQRLREMTAHLDEAGRFLDRDKFLGANEAYHAAVVGLAENEYLSNGFRHLRLRELLTSALKDTASTPENVISAHEEVTDAIAAGDIDGAVRAILSWGQTSRATIQDVLGADVDGGVELGVSHVVDTVSHHDALEQATLISDVDALVAALDARAALEIGIMQTLGDWLANETERDALVARLRAFTPLVRGTTPVHVSRYIRASDAFHRIFFSLLRNPALFEVYNSMDLPELLRRVLEVAPISIREIFDDHKSLTDALLSGDVNAASAAMIEKANRIRTALASFLADAAKAPGKGAAVA
ncbi:MAG TPA: AMP-binding protein [Vicinamibacterales bacterium]|nr:AMP-binding protein [Vicinamibacterales bacterium]